MLAKLVRVSWTCSEWQPRLRRQQSMLANLGWEKVRRRRPSTVCSCVRLCTCLRTVAALLTIRSMLADKAIVVHANVSPLVLTMLAESESNVGLLLDAVPRLTSAVEPMRAAFTATAVRATVS